jgi:hypothetical protein
MNLARARRLPPGNRAVTPECPGTIAARAGRRGTVIRRPILPAE